MKYSFVFLLWLACGLVSCYDDKGNYDYKEIDELTISGIPEEPRSALYKLENLTLSPIVTSKFEGEIAADNPNYEFSYYYNKSAGGDFLLPSLLDSAMVKDLDVLAVMAPGNYTGWFKVKDLRTNIVTSTEFKFEVGTPTTKGWLVLCEEGVERKVRVDMVGEVGDRIVISRDLLDFLPRSYGALQLFMESNMAYTGSNPYLNLYTEDGSFRLNSKDGSFSSTDYGDPRGLEFLRKIDDIIAVEDYNYTYVVITTDGDVYHRGVGNSTYDVKINVDVPFTEPTYKIAPFVGVKWANGYNGVLYDMTNKVFKCYRAYAYPAPPNYNKYLFDLPEPTEAKYFDWKTGKEMVYMAGTRQGQGQGLVFALMKDNLGQYSIYGITTGSYLGLAEQYSYIDIEAGSAPGLESATCFAFCPTLPFLFYNNGSDIYLYDMAIRKATRVVSLPGETISMLKFNRLISMGNGYPDAAKDQQYRLAVGSAKSGAEVGSEGVLRFYDVPEFAADLIQFGDTYSGFGVIKDIAYKAR